MKAKKIIGFALMTLLAPSLVFARDSFTSSMSDMMMTILEIASLSWITDKLPATKFAIFMIIFTVIYAILYKGLTKASGSKLENPIFKDKKVSGVISFAMAALTVMFIPDQIALDIGTMYGFIFTLILALFPVIAIAVTTYIMTKGNKGRSKHGIRLIMALICFMIFSAVIHEYASAFYILPLIWINKGGHKE